MADPLILASSSPRRRELLTQAGIPFELFVPQVEEACDLPAREAVAELSRRKALAAAASRPGRFILASDTLVAIDGAALGKPRDPDDACRMLRLLSGRTHEVFTGVTVVAPEGTSFTETDASRVTFDPLTEEEIASYVATGEPLDKAGAYAVQGIGSLFVRHLDGNYSGVVGLPLYLVRHLLRKAGYPVL
ncbi:MAG: septum formation protein Maf [Clostridia bacterium]|nr:septum formation protein Maf [Clostridia bacterium]